MSAQRHPIRARRLNVWICALLAALLLYNPFAAVCVSHGTFEVHTLQRNRASVGASELQHFCPVQDGSQQVEVNLESNREEVAEPAETFVAHGYEREVEVPQSDIVSKIWSRPPPLA
ncbi:MAG TPA: hypothetical protein VFI38_02770 [Candidatus Acidoferrum sp.]|nr:hypothetical protein [Candidatus Acidoferrum sp.]